MAAWMPLKALPKALPAPGAMGWQGEPNLKPSNGVAGFVAEISALPKLIGNYFQ
jgi:hypothetical protein